MSEVSYSALRTGAIKVVARGSTSPPPALAYHLTNGSNGATGNEGQSTKYHKRGRRTAMQAQGYPFATIKATVQDATKHGTGKIILMPEIRIVTTKNTIQPLYTSEIIDDSRTEVNVSVTVSGILWPNYTVTLLCAAFEGSGGHDHLGNRPTGRFVTGPSNNESTTQTISFTTTNDIYTTKYKASEFGGKEIILATLELTPPLADIATVTVKVPGLDSLPKGTNYDKVGGTCNHYGPRDDTQYEDCRTTDNNHWATVQVIQNIDAIAMEYRGQFPTLPRLAINDMSLPFGGKFDINGLWVRKKRHEYHRFGMDVDVRSSTIPETSVTDFNQICLDFGVVKVLLEDQGKDNEHYHLFFWDANN